MLSVFMLTVFMMCFYGLCLYDEFLHVECLSAKCLYAKRHCADRHGDKLTDSVERFNFRLIEVGVFFEASVTCPCNKNLKHFFFITPAWSKCLSLASFFRTSLVFVSKSGGLYNKKNNGLCCNFVRLPEKWEPLLEKRIYSMITFSAQETSFIFNRVESKRDR